MKNKYVANAADYIWRTDCFIYEFDGWVKVLRREIQNPPLFQKAKLSWGRERLEEHRNRRKEEATGASVEATGASGGYWRLLWLLWPHTGVRCIVDMHQVCQLLPHSSPFPCNQMEVFQLSPKICQSRHLRKNTVHPNFINQKIPTAFSSSLSLQRWSHQKSNGLFSRWLYNNKTVTWFLMTSSLLVLNEIQLHSN